VLDVIDDALLAHADRVIREEDDEGAGRRRVEVRGGPGQARHQAHEVRGEDEQAEGRDQRQVGTPGGTHDVLDGVLELLEHDLHRVLHARGTSSSRRVAMNAIPARMIIISHV